MVSTHPLERGRERGWWVVGGESESECEREREREREREKEDVTKNEAGRLPW